MRVYRGRRDAAASDRAVTRDLIGDVRERGEPAIRVWYPPPQVAFTRRDRARDGYDAARRAATDRGFVATERETGGRAVAFTGDVLGVVRAEPVDATESGIGARYETTVSALQRAFEHLGVDVRRGEPADAWCPGTHSLQAGGKIAGFAQRVRRDVALVAGAVVVRDADAVRAVLTPVYTALDIAFDPASVGTVAAAGGPTDHKSIRQAVESALLSAGEPTVVSVSRRCRNPE